MRFLKEYYSLYPIRCILAVALLLRLIAAIFAKGYGMHDDHFLIIEAAGSWADGADYNSWLPSSGNTIPKGHSLFYVGLHYILFAFLNLIGITSPEVKMYIVRIIHAIYSLSIVYFGYKITNKYAGKKLASHVAWLLAIFWFMPWLSVRNLVEFQCIPFLLWGTWIYLKKDNPTIKTVILSGLIAGIAFSIRFQAIFFLSGFGLALLFLKQFRNAIIWGVSTVFMMLFIQGAIDLYIWNRPWAELFEYVRYNYVAAEEYLQGSVFKYVFVILGLLIPPVSVFIFWGFFARWKKYLLLFLPSFIFLLFHSFFVNKQERFILTIIPSVIILGMIGWHEFMGKYREVNWLKKFIKGSWIFAAIVNVILLGVTTFHYSKKARVETMLYLSQYNNIECFVTTNSVPLLPRFYLGQWITQVGIDEENISNEIGRLQKRNMEPRFVVIVENENNRKAIDSLQVYYPDLVFDTEISPNFLDLLLHKMNHHNKNETLIIYRNRKYYPSSM